MVNTNVPENVVSKENPTDHIPQKEEQKKTIVDKPKEETPPKRSIEDSVVASKEVKKLESSLKRQAEAINKIASSINDPSIRATASIMALKLRTLHLEISTVLASGGYIPDSKLEEIKQKKKAIENARIESKSVALFAKTAVNKAEKLSSTQTSEDQNTATASPEDTLESEQYEKNLDQIITKTISGEQQKTREEAFAELKRFLGSLPEREKINDLPEIEDSAQLDFILSAIQRNTLKARDIHSIDIAEALTVPKHKEGIVYEDQTGLDVMDLITSGAIKNIAEVTDVFNSNNFSDVRQRTELAKSYLDSLLTQSVNRVITEEDIDNLFLSFNLDSKLARERENLRELLDNYSDKIDDATDNTAGNEEEKIPKRDYIEANYAQADITKNAYKTVVAERNSRLLEQQKIRFHGLSGLRDDQNIGKEYKNLESQLDDENISSAKKINLVREFIQKHNREEEGDQALKKHFLSKIGEDVVEHMSKAGSEIPKLDLKGNVEISVDENSGYYVLIFENKEDFDKYTMSNGNVLGAAHKKENVFLIRNDTKYDTDGQTIEVEERNELSTIKIHPSLKEIAKHEIAHLAYKDKRELQLERENVFTAHMISNLISPYVAQEIKSDLQNIIRQSLDGENDTQKIITSIFGELTNRIGGNTELSKISTTKIELILKYYKQKRSEIFSEGNDLGKKHKQVEELSAEMLDKLADSKGKLTFASLGLTKTEYNKFSIFLQEDGSPTSKFNMHNVESINMLRILNRAIPEDYSVEKRQEILEKWAARIMKFDEFNTTNTLSFIFDILQHDKELQLSHKLFNLEDRYEQKPSVENEYLRIARRYKDGAFRAYVLDQFNRGKLEGVKSRQDIDMVIEQTYQAYNNLIREGLEKEYREDLSIPEDMEDREVENDLFLFASRPDYDLLVAKHNEEGNIGFPLANSPFAATFRSAIGLDPKAVAEKFGGTLIPMKPFTHLPFGLGENRQVKKVIRENGILPHLYKRLTGHDLIDESITSAHYRERTGEIHLDMDIQEKHSLIVEMFAKRLQESKHYLDPVQIYILLYERSGLAYSNEGQIITTYKALTLQRESYMANHLYVTTNREGELVDHEGKVLNINNIRHNEGAKIYQSLVDRGYSGLDLHLLMEAHNVRQKFIDSTGTETYIDEDFPIVLGTVTKRNAERTKMMRYEGGANKGEKHIATGQKFDEISQWIMELQKESYEYFKNTGRRDPNMIYSLLNVFKAIDEVDNLKIGVNGIETIEDFKKAKKTVTLKLGDKSKEFSRELLKEYISCFYYGRTYEAMALGVYGDQEVVRIQSEPIEGTDGEREESLFEIRENFGYQAIGETEKNRLKQDFVNDWKSIDVDAAKVYYEMVPGRQGEEKTSFDDLTMDAKKRFIEQVRNRLIEEYKSRGLVFNRIGYSSLPAGIVDENNRISDQLKEGIPTRLKTPGKDIYIQLPGQVVPKVVKAHGGLTKQEIVREFGEFVFNDDNEHPDSYSLKDINGKLINSVEDVVGEKSQISAQYFYLRQLITQAENYIGISSANKEKWVGTARFAMISKWLHATMLIVSFVAFPPALAGLFLNPISLAILLANTFLISNWLTKQGDLWGKRKVSGIQAANKIRELEPYFEEAFFDKTFSSGPKRQRLLNILKSAEEILKSSKVVTVDTPTNSLDHFLRTLGTTAKEMAT